MLQFLCQTCDANLKNILSKLNFYKIKNTLSIYVCYIPIVNRQNFFAVSISADPSIHYLQRQTIWHLMYMYRLTDSFKMSIQSDIKSIQAFMVSQQRHLTFVHKAGHCAPICKTKFSLHYDISKEILYGPIRYKDIMHVTLKLL